MHVGGKVAIRWKSNPGEWHGVGVRSVGTRCWGHGETHIVVMKDVIAEAYVDGYIWQSCAGMKDS